MRRPQMFYIWLAVVVGLTAAVAMDAQSRHRELVRLPVLQAH